VTPGPSISELTLAAPAAAMGELARFYGALELETAGGDGRLDVAVGDARLTFTASDGEPFYHFAFLVPGDGFEAAYAWLGERAEILPDARTGETVFDFSFWDALACYVHDPAGNIVELIAHRDHPGEFESGRDLLAISEIGLVTPDPHATARSLHDELGLELWSGDLDSLGFVGRKAHTLILCRPGRGWLPTGRPAEQHPVAFQLKLGG
jgi:catechol 2,3-dioxygenase-like lactoylglutathione lyase family enzyme